MSRRREYLLILAVSLGGLLGPFNANMLAVALPDIRADFGIGHGAIGWLVTLYLIGTAVAQPVLGRLGDQIGRSFVFRGALMVFLLASFAAATAPRYPFLVLARVGQAVSAGALMPNGLAMLRDVIPVHRLGRTYGLNGSLMALAGTVSPLVAGVVLTVAHWRWLLTLNLPVVLAASAVLFLARYRTQQVRAPAEIDWTGVIAYAGVLLSAVFLLNAVPAREPLAIVAAFGSLAVLGVLLAYRLRTSDVPVIEWRLFRMPTFAGAAVHGFSSTFVVYASVISIPFFLREVQGASNSTVGLMIAAMAIMSAVIAPFSGRVADTMGRRLPTVLGSTAMLAGTMTLLIGLREQQSLVVVAVFLALIGLGSGLSFGPATTAAVEAAPKRLAGSASGTLMAIRFVGALVGVSMLAGILGSEDVPDVGTFRIVFAAFALMAGVSTFGALRIHRFPEGPQPSTADRLFDAAETQSTHAS